MSRSTVRFRWAAPRITAATTRQYRTVQAEAGAGYRNPITHAKPGQLTPPKAGQPERLDELGVGPAACPQQRVQLSDRQVYSLAPHLCTARRLHLRGHGDT